jgi:zinc and cadmium transporter
MPLTYAIISTLFVSVIAFVGLATLPLKPKASGLISLLVSLAAGAMLGDAFIHLLPEAFTTNEQSGLYVLLGLAIFFIFERILHWHHHGEDEDVEVRHHHVGYMSLAADSLHNLIDGALIGVAFQASLPIGLATTIAVVLHEVPQELGDYAILIHSGFTPRRALMLNFATALLATLGAILTFAFAGTQSGASWLLPVTAGGFIYVATADLIPELQRDRHRVALWLQLIGFGVGIGIMWLMTLFG